MTRPRFALVGLVILASALALTPGCESGSLLMQAGRGAGDKASTLVLLDGEPLSTAEARSRAGELAGGVVVEELVLERRLEQVCAENGVVIMPADLERERADLIASIERGGIGASTAGVLDRVRAERGLGPRRFGALLRRNAMLRALVRHDVEVREEEVDLAVRLAGSPSRRVHAIFGLAGMDPGPIARRMRDVAGRLDTPEQIEAIVRGIPKEGGLPRIAVYSTLQRENPYLDKGLIEGAFGAPVGGVSGPIVVESGWVLVYVAAETPGNPAGIDRDSARTELRRRKERLEMERLASRLVREADTVVIDPSYGWSYRNRTGAGG